MSQRLAFVEAVLHRAPGQSILDVCRAIGISERVGHRWLKRFGAGGPAALADRSHAPHAPAHQLAPTVIDAILALRTEQPSWGARKLREVLRREQPETAWPAPSTITTLLKRVGLITPRRRTRRERSAWAYPALTEPQQPNDVWTADFKGQFRLSRGPYCYPLTIGDLHSRFVLAVRALEGTQSDPALGQFHRCFAEYGLPRVIRTDNGVPFGAPGALGGLSSLAVWWIRLGIRPERIEPGEPQQNGVHERMHRTLKRDATRFPSATMAEQQRRFDQWRHTFNQRRPHESLNDTPPATHYTPSPRPLRKHLPMIEYPAQAELRRVDMSGYIKWRNARVFLSGTLAGEYVGLQESADGEWTINFGPLALGAYSEHLLAFQERLAWTPQAP
jgi:transposase InsO family protein